MEIQKKSIVLEPNNLINIQGICMRTELQDNVSEEIQKKKILNTFTVGDVIRAVIISIEKGSNLPVVFLSMKNSLVETKSLGPSKIPVNTKYYNLVLNYFDKGSYNSQLLLDKTFMNPCAMGMMIKYFNINENGSLCNEMKWKEKDYWDKIRDEQNFSWAQETHVVRLTIY